MLNPQELGHLTDDIEKIWQELEDELLADMAQRIVKNDYSFPTTAAWNKQKLEEIGVQYDYIVRQLSRTLKLSEKQVKHIIGKSVQAAVDTDNQVFKAALDAELLESMSDTSELLSKFIADGVKSTNGELRNFARTYAADASKAYEHAIDQAYLQVTNGFYTAQQASQTAIEQLARQGITSAITPSGRREHADVIVRRAVRTGTNQAALKAQEANFFEMGAQLVEVTAHYGARPSHAEWQGQVYEWTKSGQQKHTSYPDFVNSTGYGTGAGLGGWNCRHSFYPFFEGLSERAYEPLNAQETERVYELEQQQRYNERMIREWTRRQKTLEAGGYDANKEREKVREWKKRNDNLIKANPDVLKKKYANGKVTFAKRGKTVLEKFLKAATPGKGNVFFPDDYNHSTHKSEIKMAEWLLENFGGNIHLLNESQEDKVKMPDFEWNGKLWDLKDISTAKAADSAIRKGLKQIDSNPGGIILDLVSDDIQIEDLLPIIEKRVLRNHRHTVDILIKKEDKLIKLLRYEKKIEESPARQIWAHE